MTMGHHGRARSPLLPDHPSLTYSYEGYLHNNICQRGTEPSHDLALSMHCLLWKTDLILVVLAHLKLCDTTGEKQIQFRRANPHKHITTGWLSQIYNGL